MKINLVLIVTLFSILLSCQQEEINFRDLRIANSSLNYEIVVNGFISTENTACKVTLSKPVSIDENIEFKPINEAIVTLKKGDNKTYLFQYDTLGVYISIDSIQGECGIAYELEIFYNNKIYNTEEVMPEEPDNNFDIPFYRATQYDDNENELPLNDDFIELTILQHNFGYETPTIWQWVYGNKDSIPYWDLFDLSRLFFRAYTHRGSLPQGIFPSGIKTSGTSGFSTDSLEIIKMAISEKYYEYLISVFNETAWKNGVFSTIAGNVKTNVSEGGMGYFYAINVKRKRFTYKELGVMNK